MSNDLQNFENELKQKAERQAYLWNKLRAHVK